MVEIKIAKKENAADMVKIHKSAFPQHFWTSLGDGFIEYDYGCMCSNPKTITLCAYDDEKMVGFSTTALLCQGFNLRRIKYGLFGYLSEGLKLLFTRPKALIRLLKNFTKKSDTVQDDGQYAELFSIAVYSEYQGRGVGKALLKETERLAKESNVKKISLTTDKYDNEKTLSFYKKNGYGVFYEFLTYPNREMLRLIKEL